MEILFDALFDLLLTGGECAVRSNKVPKPIRIFLAIIGLLRRFDPGSCRSTYDRVGYKKSNIDSIRYVVH